MGSGSAEGSGRDDGPVGGDSGKGGGAGVGAAAAAEGPAPGGVRVGVNAPPLLNPVDQPPAGGMAADFEAWGETRNADEHAKIRDDLTSNVWSGSGDLLAPYVS